MLGDRLRKLRKDRQITLEKMSQDLGTTKVTISRYENGNRVPNIDILCKIADYFEVSLDYLCGRDCIRGCSDLKEAIDDIVNSFDGRCDILFDGLNMDSKSYDNFVRSLEVIVEISKSKLIK